MFSNLNENQNVKDKTQEQFAYDLDVIVPAVWPEFHVAIAASMLLELDTPTSEVGWIVSCNWAETSCSSVNAISGAD